MFLELLTQFILGHHAIEPPHLCTAADVNQVAAYYKALLADIPAAQKPLFYMTMMFMEAAMSVEFFYEPDVPEALGAEYMVVYPGSAEQVVNA